MSVMLVQERSARFDADTQAVSAHKGLHPLVQSRFTGQVVVVMGMMTTGVTNLARLIAQALESAVCLDIDHMVVEYMHVRYQGKYWDYYDRYVHSDDDGKLEYIRPALEGQLAQAGSRLVIIGGFPQSKSQAEELLSFLTRQPIAIDLMSDQEPNKEQLELRRYVSRQTAYLAIEPTDMGNARLQALRFLNQFNLLPAGLLSD